MTPNHSPLVRRASRPIRIVAGAAVAALAVSGLAASTGAGAAYAADSGQVVVTGHGWGHGRGMGQYGALGYAVDKGWPYQQILGYFYGGTTLSGDAGNPVIRVEITARQDQDAIVTGSQLKLLSGVSLLRDLPGVTAVRLVKSGASSAHLYTTTTPPGANACAGPWTDEGVDFAANGVASLVVGTGADSSQPSGMLRVCNSSGSTAYRGELEVFRSASGTQYLINRVDVDGYLRGVVPRESPAAWGDLGGGAGMNALKAQAVTARSYAMASSRSGSGATTCDTDACQVYGGAALYSSAGLQTKLQEDPRTNDAVAGTSGQVMRAAGGGIARTEFSSSTGGWTAGGTFPAVSDEGDTRSPYHDWTVTTSLAEISTGLGVGAIARIAVTGRNGLGADGGRVTQVTAVLADGSSRTFTGDQVRQRLGLRSDWFTFTGSQVCAAPGGYWLATAKGAVYGKCDARDYGSASGVPINNPVVTMASTPSGLGYWLVASDGGVFSFGDAAFYGSTGAIRLNKPIVTAMTTSTGRGYWLVASDGGVFTFGDAAFYGSTGAIRLNKPIVTAIPTPSGAGYWLVASDGGVFTFGDAQFYGSTGAIALNKPIVAAAATDGGKGYWMFASDGGVFTFGDAPFLGSLGDVVLDSPVVAAARP